MATADTEGTSCRHVPGLPHALWRLQALSTTVGKTEPHFEKKDVEAVRLIKRTLLRLVRREERARQLCEVESVTLTRNRFLIRRAACVLEQERAEFISQARDARVQQLAELDASLTANRGHTHVCQQGYLALRLENKAMLEELEVQRPELYKMQRANAEAMLKKEMEMNRLEVLRSCLQKHKAAICTTQEIIDKTCTRRVEERLRADAEKEKMDMEIASLCTELEEQLKRNKDAKEEVKSLWDRQAELLKSIRQANDNITKTQNHDKEVRLAIAEGQKYLVKVRAENVFKQQENESLKCMIDRLEQTIAVERTRKQDWELPVQEAEETQRKMAEKRRHLYSQSSQASKSLRQSNKLHQDVQKTLDLLTQKLRAATSRVKALEMDIDQMKKATQRIRRGGSTALQQKLHNMKRKIQTEREKQDTEKREKERTLEIMTRMNFARELQLQIEEIDNSIRETSDNISSLQDQLQTLQRTSNRQEYAYIETCGVLIEVGEKLRWNLEDFQRQADLELDKTTYFEAFERSMAKALAEMQWRVEQVMAGKRSSYAQTELHRPIRLWQRSAAVDHEFALLRRSIQQMIQRTKHRVHIMERSRQLKIEVSPRASDRDCTLSDSDELETAGDPCELEEGQWPGRAPTEEGYVDPEAPCRRDETHVHPLPRGLRYYAEIGREVGGILAEMQFVLDQLLDHKTCKEKESENLRRAICYIKVSYFDIRQKTASINKRIMIQIEDSCRQKKELEEKFIVLQIKIEKVDEETQKIKSAEHRLEKELEQLRENLQWNLKIIPQLQEVLDNSDDSWRHEVAKKIGDIPSARLAIQNLEVMESEVTSRMITVSVTSGKVVAELERFAIPPTSPGPLESAENTVSLPLPRPPPSRPSQRRLDERRFRIKSLSRASQPHKQMSSVSGLAGSSGASQNKTHRFDKASNKSVKALPRSDTRAKLTNREKRPVLRGMGQPCRSRDLARVRRASRSRLPAKTTSTPASVGARKTQVRMESYTSRGRLFKSESYSPTSHKYKATENRDNKDKKRRVRPIPVPPRKHHCMAGSGDAPRGAVQNKAEPVSEEETFLKSLREREWLSRAKGKRPETGDPMATHSNVAQLAKGVGFLIKQSHPANSDLDTISRVYADQLFSAYLKGCRSPRKPKKTRLTAKS